MLKLNYDGIAVDFDFSRCSINFKPERPDNYIDFDNDTKIMWDKFIKSKSLVETNNFNRWDNIYTILINSGKCSLNCPYCITDLYDFIETDHNIEEYKQLIDFCIEREHKYDLSFSRKEAFENLEVIQEVCDFNTNLDLIQTAKIFTNGHFLINNNFRDTPYQRFAEREDIRINLKVTFSVLEVGHMNIRRVDEIAKIISNIRELVDNKKNKIEFVILMDHEKVKFEDWKVFIDLLSTEPNIVLYLDGIDYGIEDSKDKDLNKMIQDFFPFFDYALSNGVNLVSNFEMKSWSINTTLLPELFDIPKFLCNAGQTSLTMREGKIVCNFDFMSGVDYEEFIKLDGERKSIHSRVELINKICQKHCGKNADAACHETILEEGCPIFKGDCLRCNEFFICNDHCNFHKPNKNFCLDKEVYFFYALLCFLHKYKNNPECVSDIDILNKAFMEKYDGKI